MSHDYRGDTVPERLARLEEQMEDITKAQEKENTDLAHIRGTLEELKQELSRYKGFFGGIIFVFSCLAAALKMIPYVNGLFNK